MDTKQPLGIKFISCFQLIGGFTLLFTLNNQQTPLFNIRFNVPFIPELVVKICVGVLALIIAYGYLKQFKWGYWSMLIYSILFCCISLINIIKYTSQPFIGNAIYAAIVTIYTLLHSKYFIVSSKVR